MSHYLPNRIQVPGSLAQLRAEPIQQMLKLSTQEAAQRELAAYRPRDTIEADHAQTAIGLRAVLNNACQRMIDPDLPVALAPALHRTIAGLARELRITLAALERRQAMDMTIADPAWDRSPYNPAAGEMEVLDEDPVDEVPSVQIEVEPCAAPEIPVDGPEQSVPVSRPIHESHPVGHGGGDALARFASGPINPELTADEAREIALQARGIMGLGRTRRRRRRASG